VIAASLTGRARTWALYPHPGEVNPDVRGFSPWAEGESIVADVGTAFLTGYRAGLQARRCTDAITDLQQLPDQWRGFAMEGLGMAAGVRSAISPLDRHQFDEVVLACGERHGYMLYVGLGWSMARTPRLTWPRLSRFDPLLAALILDGYGFHEVFFNTRRVLEQGLRGMADLPWPGSTDQARQHVMQGIGRGMWFVTAGSPPELTRRFAAFPANLRASLWAGCGLAAAYAGGRDGDGLAELRTEAGEHAAALGQGAAFAVEARRRASTVVDHTGIAARVLCGRSIAEVHELVVAATPASNDVDAPDWTAYERWRHAVIGALALPALAANGARG